MNFERYQANPGRLQIQITIKDRCNNVRYLKRMSPSSFTSCYHDGNVDIRAPATYNLCQIRFIHLNEM